MFVETREPHERVRVDGPAIRISKATRRNLRALKRLTGRSFDSLVNAWSARELEHLGVDPSTMPES